MPSSLQQRIRFLRTRRDQTQESFGGTLGISKAAVAQWEGGKTKPTTEKLRVIADLCGVSLDWLASDESEIPPPPVVTQSLPIAPTDGRVWFDLDGRIPVVGHAQLGDNGHFVELEYPAGQGDGFVILPARDKAAYALRCEGSSMVPRIRPGEYVVVEPSYEPAPGDEVVVKSTDGRVMVKVYQYWRDDHLYLGSINNTHPTISLARSEVAVMHRVFAIVNRFLWIPE